MGKIIGLTVIGMLFLGCDLLSYVAKYNEEAKNFDLALTARAIGHELYDLGLDDINSFEDIANYLNENIEYKKEPSGADIWKDPEKTFKDGYGDCDDFAIAFMNIAYFSLGIKMELAAVDCTYSTQRVVIEGGNINHAAVSYNGQLYSAYKGTAITQYRASYIFYFDVVFSNSMNN